MVGTTSFSGEAFLGNGIVSTGKATTSGSQKIDPHTGTVTLGGGVSFKGSTLANGKLVFSGETGSNGYQKLDCSNDQCEDGKIGKDLGAGGSASLDGKSISEFG